MSAASGCYLNLLW